MRGLILLLMLFLLSTFTHAQPDAPEPILTLGRGEIVSAAWSPDGQSIWISTTAGTWQLDTNLREIAAYPHITYAALSPDGMHLAGISSDGFVGLWSTTTGNEEWRKEHPSDTARVPVWSPDGSRFTHSQHGFLIVELIHNRTVPNTFTSFDLRGATARYIAWSASGTYLAAYVDGDGIWVIDVIAQQRIRLEDHELAFDEGTSFLVWSGDSQLEWLSLGDGSNGYSWLLPGGENLESIPGPYYDGYSHSPDGQYSAGIGIVKLSIVHIPTKMTVYEDPNNHYRAPTWSPDSRRLAIVQSDWRDHSIQAVVVFDPFASSEVWRQDQVGYTADRLIWNETGTHLLAVGLGRVALLDGETGEILSHNENFREFSLAAPDSNAQHIAVADTFGDVLIIDIKRGNKIDEVAGFTFPVIELAWQPQGNTLAILNYLSSPGSGKVQLWQSDTSSASGTFNLPESSLDDLWAVDIAWNSDGSSFAVATSRLVSLFGTYQGTFDFIDPDDPLNDVHIYEVRWTETNEPVARYSKCCHRPPSLKNAITGISSFVSESAWQLSPSGEIVTTRLGRTFAIENYPMTISIHRVSKLGETMLTLDWSSPDKME